MKRDFIFDTIRKVFRLYGYQPIETPAMENLSTLLGKYGEEGDKLLFRILNSGDFSRQSLIRISSVWNRQKLSSIICERGLRYDLTVPFARFVVQHRDEITFPFKSIRSSLSGVPTARRKAGTASFFNAMLMLSQRFVVERIWVNQDNDEIFSRLKIAIVIKINNRKYSQE